MKKRRGSEADTRHDARHPALSWPSALHSPQRICALIRPSTHRRRGKQGVTRGSLRACTRSTKKIQVTPRTTHLGTVRGRHLCTCFQLPSAISLLCSADRRRSGGQRTLLREPLLRLNFIRFRVLIRFNCFFLGAHGSFCYAISLAPADGNKSTIFKLSRDTSAIADQAHLSRS